MKKRMASACILAASAALALAVGPAAQAATATEASAATLSKSTVNSVSLGITTKAKLTASTTVTITGGKPQVLLEAVPTEWVTGAAVSLKQTGVGDLISYGEPAAKCVATTVADTYTCTSSYTLDAATDVDNEDAGPLGLVVGIVAKDDSERVITQTVSASLKRVDKLTVKASTTSIKKGASVTITGTLTRANWDEGKYSGYGGRTLTLLKRNAGSTTWAAVKTVTTDSHGNIKTTVKPGISGAYRLAFAGNAISTSVGSLSSKSITVK